MKKAMKVILPILLAALLIGGCGWYMFVYDPGTVQEFLNAQASNFARSGNFEAASWLYTQSVKLAGQDENTAIELANIYKDAGNYTKAESTLAKALAEGPNTELYMALCHTYVEQDKLLDAVNMLDNISDPTIKAELDQLRPAAPSSDYEPGIYNEYITLTFGQADGTLYVTTDGEYPSTAMEAYAEPFTLASGETRVQALVVAENGLVSPLSVLNYTIVGVVEEVTLSDPAIDASIRETLLFSDSTKIYTDDLWSVEEFEVPAEAASLEDLKYLTHLKKLTISDRSIQTLDFLAGMTQLEELNLDGCSVPDALDVIGGLPALKKLSMAQCNLTTIAKLNQAVGLTDLNLSNNAIGDISVLSAMTQMTVLNLSHNAVTDLTAINSMNQLTELDLSYNSVSSIAPAGVCLNLKKLDITNNTVSDLTSLSTLTGLTHFYASYNALTDVSVLAGCTQLQELNISNNTLEDISALSSLSQLTDFDFSYNDVTVLPTFAQDCALIRINGEHNFMEDISALGGLPNLTHVYMDYNNLSDISFLANCPNLVQVNVYGTNVADIEALLEHSIIVNYDPT